MSRPTAVEPNVGLCHGLHDRGTNPIRRQLPGRRRPDCVAVLRSRDIGVGVCSLMIQDQIVTDAMKTESNPIAHPLSAIRFNVPHPTLLLVACVHKIFVRGEVTRTTGRLCC